ncbi:MAG TPA: tetratricopeptide repeat protein [Phycisphaerae bacterium]|nr:tetratricopeptide repeat protein [Phycisphaerae bacterium]HRY69472.1 tetratricopeptide repeat protein [Phycisphaerae bacterium]HSA29114.1 tetratricopeptide repeat protein [Phycisphaerae bacterium]
MAKRLNKKLVVGMTVVGMFLTILAAFLVVTRFLPKQDPGPAVANAERAAKLGTLEGYKEAARQYNTAANRAKALADSAGAGGTYEEDSKNYRLQAGDMALKAGDPKTAVEMWNRVILADPNYGPAYERKLDLVFEYPEFHFFGSKDIEDFASNLLKVQPESTKARHALGLALLAQVEARRENLAAGEYFLRQAVKPDKPKADAEQEKPNADYVDSLARHLLQQSLSDENMKQYDESMEKSLAALAQSTESWAAQVPKDFWKPRPGSDLAKEADQMFEDLTSGHPVPATPSTSPATSPAPEKDEAEQKAIAASVEAWRKRGIYCATKAELQSRQWASLRQKRASPEELTGILTAIKETNDKALECLETARKIAEQLEPDDPARIDSLIALAKYYRSMFPSQPEDTKASQKEQQSNNQVARKFYEEAIKSDRYGFDAYRQLADLLRTDRDLEEAVRLLAQRYVLGIKRVGMEAIRNRQAISDLRDDLFNSLYYLPANPGMQPIKTNKDLLTSFSLKDADGQDAKTPDGRVIIVPSLEELCKDQAADLGEDAPSVLVMKALIAIIQGNHAIAVRSLEEASKKINMDSPKSMEERRLALKIAILLAEEYRVSNTPGLAINMLRQAKKLSPGHTWVLATLAERILAEGTNSAGQIDEKAAAEALPIAEQVLLYDPDNQQGNVPLALPVLFRIHQSQKNWDRLKEIQDLMAKYRTPTDAPQAALTDKLQKALLLAMRAESSTPPDAQLQAQAEKLFLEVLEASPFNNTAVRNLVGIYSQSQQAEKLTQLLERQKTLANEKLAALATTTQPGEVDQKKAYQQYITLLDRWAVLADPRLSDSDRIKKREEMSQADLEASASDEDRLRATLELYQLKMVAARRATQPEEADRLATEGWNRLRQALDLAPTSKNLVDELFNLALTRQDWKVAEEMVGKAVEIGLDPSKGCFYRGRLCLRQGIAENKPELLQKAAKELESGLKEFPSFPTGRIDYASALLRLNKIAEATREFEKALELDARNSEAALRLAHLASLRKDDQAEADKTRYLELCKQLIPNNPWVREQLQGLADAQDPQAGIVRRESLRASNPKDLLNLMALARLYQKVGETAKADAVHQDILKTDPKDTGSVVDPWEWRAERLDEYARFIRTSKPEDSVRVKALLEELRDQVQKQPAPIQATAQMVYASHLAGMAAMSPPLPDSPTLQQVDDAYEKAASLANSPRSCLQLCLHYQATARQGAQDDQSVAIRLAKAEEWARKAVELAETQKWPEGSHSARQILIDLLLASPELNEAKVRKEIEAYQATQVGDSWELLAESNLLVHIGQLDQALATLKKYIAQNPKDAAAAHLTRSEIFSMRGQWLEAADELRQVKASNPKGYDYIHRLRLARCLLNIEQSELAVAELNSILADDPGNKLAVRMLMRIYNEKQAWPAAETLLLSLREKDPRNYLWPLYLSDMYVTRGNGEAAMQYGTDAIRLSDYNDAVVEEVLRGGVKVRQNDRVFRIVAEMLPDRIKNRPQFLALAGSALADKGEREAAIKLYNQALDATGDAVELFGFIALDARARLGDDTVAEMLSQRLSTNPQHAAARYVQSTAKQRAGDMDGFIKDLEDILQSLPKEDPRLLMNRLGVLQSLASSYYRKESLDKAKEKYEELIELTRSYKSAPGLAKYHVYGLNNLAYLLIDKQKDPKSAFPYSAEAASIQPDPNVVDTLAWNYVLLGQHDKAVHLLRQVVKNDEARTPAILYHLAEGLHRKAQELPEGEQKESTLKDAKACCTEAYALIDRKKADVDNVLGDLMVLGEKLGLKFEKLNLGQPGTQGPS